jgi:hypothetical protein
MFFRNKDREQVNAAFSLLAAAGTKVDDESREMIERHPNVAYDIAMVFRHLDRAELLDKGSREMIEKCIIHIGKIAKELRHLEIEDRLFKNETLFNVLIQEYLLSPSEQGKLDDQIDKRGNKCRF